MNIIQNKEKKMREMKRRCEREKEEEFRFN